MRFPSCKLREIDCEDLMEILATAISNPVDLQQEEMDKHMDMDGFCLEEAHDEDNYPGYGWVKFVTGMQTPEDLPAGLVEAINAAVDRKKAGEKRVVAEQVFDFARKQAGE